MSAHPYTQRVARDRWFFERHGVVHTVPANKLPEEVGVNARSCLEVPQPPEGCHQWIGPGREWMVSTVRTQRAERRARFDALDRGDLLAMIEDLQARMAALEAQGGAGA